MRINFVNGMSFDCLGGAPVEIDRRAAAADKQVPVADRLVAAAGRLVAAGKKA